MSNISNAVDSLANTIGTLEPQVSAETDLQNLMTVEAVQKVLHRSRASVYRYANTDTLILNPPFDHTRLNPESRQHKEEPLMFHPNEVARFAQDVLKIKQVIIEINQPPETLTHQLLRQVLAELKIIRDLIESTS
ncbi:resolvase [Leptolyngbya cf. ectocarpi LEGE 11479]|uniref:Resolvase n=1 Tax=Leptolyngbya cf. ectocarpi LEGE 11479 TaxID=1828722 RepID=A0A928ZU49_LEPEC|nr:resolvase [Leptolyngbya ectocarpi]MBE9067501.1 resolvase [Leptolyngbya cf. ectocarpi LEGE 11479]